MTITGQDTDTMRALRGLEDGRSSVRLRAAMAVGTTPDPRFVDKLIERSAIEPEFFVRDMLTWALTRHPVSLTLPGPLARSGDGGAALLAEGIGSPVAAVRERAVQALAELPGDEATARLRDALANPDVVVRGVAAPALGTRGVADAVPTLVDRIVEGRNDTDAADALSVLAGDRATADRIATGLVDRLAHDTTDAPARGRLAQALAGIPGTRASGAHVELSHDGDRAVALTAAYLLRLRDAG